MILKSIKHFLAASRTCIHWHYLSKHKNSVKGVYIFIIWKTKVFWGFFVFFFFLKTKILSISWSCPRFNHSSQSPAQVEVTPVHYSTWCRYARAFPQLYVDFGSPAGPGAGRSLRTHLISLSSFYPLTLTFTKRPMCLPTVGSLPLVEALYMLSAVHNQHGACPQTALSVHVMEERAECGQNSNSANPFCLHLEKSRVAGKGRPVRQFLVM